MTKRTRHSEIRVTGLDGETRIGQGDGLALAARDLGATHAAEALAEATHQAARDRRNEPDRWPTGTTAQGGGYCDPETRYTLTEQGASYLAGMRTQEYLDDPSLEGAAKMEAAYDLAERIAERGGR